jgi:hypothetical protein
MADHAAGCRDSGAIHSLARGANCEVSVVHSVLLIGLGARFAHQVKAARPGPGSTRHLDDMFVTLRGEPHLLWRAA